MTDSIFIDSNVWVYLFSQEDDRKSGSAETFIAANAESSRFVVSYQVINEVCAVLKKKGYTEPEIRRVAKDMMGICAIGDYSGDIILLASELREKHSFSFWDSQIIACALASGCSLLVSEDMQDGRKIGGMAVKNIFAS
jgi:predicted nucleic acid-binding protein